MYLIPADALGCAPPGPLALTSRPGAPLALHVASHKPSKVEPARAWALAALGPIVVCPHAVASGVPEQPIGFAAGEKGARTRWTALPSAGLRVAIESTIVLVPAPPGALMELVGPRGEVAVDVAAIVVGLDGGAPVLAWTDGVAIPARYVEETRARAVIGPEGWSVTVGATLAAALGVPGDDWHARFAGRSRAALIAAALARIPLA